MIAPHLKGLDINAIPDDLVDHVFEFIEQNLTNYSAYAFEGVPFRNEVRIRCVNNVDIVGREIKSLDEDEVVVTFDCECDVELDGFMEKHEYFSGDHDIDVWDPDWNDWVMAVSTDARLPVRALFTYSKREGGITGSNVEFPTEYSDDYH